jgi:hypothetical protein
MANDPTRPSATDPAQFPNFQEVLTALAAAYQPVLEQDLSLIQSPDSLDKEARAHVFSCADEIDLANAIFGKFWNERTAIAVLPPQAIEVLGPPDRWRWCLLHIRCCLIFGWLVCRGVRTYRRSAYYLNLYWRCVREIVGNPVSNPPTADERKDFQTLVEALSVAYKPFLEEELASANDPATGAAVLDGKIDCESGEGAAAAVFDRLLNPNIAEPLLGSKAWEQHRGDPFLWFCRCWCLCAIRFGCCLAQAKSALDLWRCLVFLFQCLVDCFRPLTCAITSPADGACAEEQQFPAIPLIGIEIDGTAAGSGCDHYILEWKAPADPPAAYTQAGIVYAGSPGPGICGIVGGTLGWLDTFSTPVPDQVEIRLSVFPVQGAPTVCTSTFAIFRKRVWISAVESVLVEAPPGVLDNSARLIDPVSHNVLSFGTALEIMGQAMVGKCFGREMKRYTLSYQAGFVNDPTLGVWNQFWQVDYNSPLQRSAMQSGNFDLTSFWTVQQICPWPPCPPNAQLVFDELIPTRWISGPTEPDSVPPAQFFHVDPQLPPIWPSQSLPSINCFSGKYTLRLAVEDTAVGTYYDLQHIWIDNKAIYGQITSLLGVPACSVLNLSQLPNAGDCTKVWPLGIEGIAYDEYIIEGDFTIPSDNFGGYCVTLTKQGGSNSACTPLVLSVALPVPGPLSPTTVGTNRVGDPGVRCGSASPAPGPFVGFSNLLTQMDGRMFDADCAASALPKPPAGFALKRADPATNRPGECCSFYFMLDVWDNSICPSLSDGRHSAPPFVWPVYICNDLPPKS